MPRRLAFAAFVFISFAAFAQEEVAVPNFWDLRARLERPTTEAIEAINFLTVDDFPPFSFRDRNGALIGFDVDLATAICEVLAVECAIQVRPFATLTDGLKEGVGNAVIAGFDPLRAESEGLVATQAYLKIPGRFVAPKDKSFDPNRPDSAFAAVACGSAHQAFLGRYFPKLRVVCYDSTIEALAEMRAGRVDAVFGDALGLSFWLHGRQSEDCCAFAGGPYVDDGYFGPGLSIVVRADDRTLKAALDYALREVYRAGTYEELYLRYFPVGLF
jgi:polar amino acid transport system substrate-binding protein